MARENVESDKDGGEIRYRRILGNERRKAYHSLLAVRPRMLAYPQELIV
jgi:hypothetical protein